MCKTRHRLIRLILFVWVVISSFAVEVSAINTHPFLITTPDEIRLARKRVNEEAWAKDTVEQLKKQAEALENEPLPVFEKDWWIEASKKHWMQTYPEINHHTNFAVAGPMVKAMYTALLYSVTEDEKYANLVRKVLLHYCDYEFFAEHPDVGLNWSVWCLRGLWAYDLVYNTVPETDRVKIDDFFTRAMEAVKKDDAWWIVNNPGGLFNNHFAWHKLMIGSYGLFYNRPDLVDYAINSDQGVRELIEHGSKDDGLWLEGSLNYQFTALIPLAEFASQLNHAGYSLDLWNHPLANGRTIRQLYEGPIDTLFPDGTLPTIGDTYGRRAKLTSLNEQVGKAWENQWYYSAYNACQSPRFAWLLKDKQNLPYQALFAKNLPPKDAPPPAMKTRIWPEHGYIALRTQEGQDYWRGDGYSVFMSYDADQIHSHSDKLGIMIFGRGKHLSIDPEAVASAQHAFSAQIQGELNRSTLCHNTIMVDEQNHTPVGSRLQLVDFVDSEDVKMVTVADEQGLIYPGIKMMRTVAATDDYVLDIFQVASDEEHTYDYLFHTYDDNGKFETDAVFKDFSLPDSSPWKWLQNAKSYTFHSDWQVLAHQDDVTSRLILAGKPGTEVILCDFPRNDRFDETPIPMLMARRKCKSTAFVTMLQAEKGELPVTSVSVSDERHGFLRVKVECNGKTGEVSVKKLQ